MPLVSVLLPVRDAQPYLAASLRSLWRQTHADFEVIAVDDGSTDGSGEALEQAAAHEPRLTVIRTPARGLPLALNTALARASGTWIARHDADDLSHRRRFELQAATLRDQPGIAVVGTRLRMFPAAQVGIGMRRWSAWHNTLLTHELMRAERHIDSPLAHGTAMVRRAWLERVGGWHECGWPEDLDLWMRLFEAGATFAKRPETLYGWRQHRRSATRRDPRYRRERFIALTLAALERGVLRDRPALTLVGVGESLARCVPVFAARRRVTVVDAAAPRHAPRASIVPPVVLVFGSYPVRCRWRRHLHDWDMCEDRDFVFIA